MAGDAHADEAQFKGLSKYFNSTTSTGRANVSIIHFSEVWGFTVVYNYSFQMFCADTIWLDILVTRGVFKISLLSKVACCRKTCI